MALELQNGIRVEVDNGDFDELEKKLKDALRRLGSRFARIVCDTRRKQLSPNAPTVISCIVMPGEERGEVKQRLKFRAKQYTMEPWTTWYTLDADIVVKDPDEAARMLRRLFDVVEEGGGWKVYDTFMEYATKSEKPYTTPGNKASIYDAGEDYLDVDVSVEYLG